MNETARRTQELLGWRFGGGVYFNYLFAALWLGDVAWWWAAPKSHQDRSRWIAWPLHAYLFLIAVNGAVVFADGPMRWVGLAATIALAAAILVGRRRAE